MKSSTNLGHVLLWNVDKRIIVNEHKVDGSSVHTVAFSPGLQNIIWQLRILSAAMLNFFHYFEDGQRILSCGADQCVRVLDVQTGTELYLKDLHDEIRY